MQKTLPLTLVLQFEIALTRYNGGTKGPVVLFHGVGVSSGMFSLDTIDVNLVEYLVQHRYLPDRSGVHTRHWREMEREREVTKRARKEEQFSLLPRARYFNLASICSPTRHRKTNFQNIRNKVVPGFRIVSSRKNRRTKKERRGERE